MSWDDDIDAPGGQVRLTRSSANADGIVEQTPESLVVQAERVLGGQRVALDRYSLARVIGSEAGTRPPGELLAVGDATLNRAARAHESVTAHVTAEATEAHRYGKQGSVTSRNRARPVATTRDPQIRHLRAADLLLGHTGARGMALGADHFFDARTQLALWESGNARSMHPYDVLVKWTFNLTVATRNIVDGRLKVTFAEETAADKAACQPGEMELVFVDGVDPWHLFLFRPATSPAMQAQSLAKAKRVLETKGAWKPRPTSRGEDLEATAIAAAAAAAIVVGGKA